VKLIDPEETIVIVIGSSSVAEERDRPLAYRLKAEIDGRGAGHAYRRAVIVADSWYLENDRFHLNPTIAIGGPGANGLSQELSGLLPTVYAQDEQVFVQAEFDGDLKRAALWGVDAARTGDAVEVFTTRGFLDDLLGRIWRFRVGTLV
jgi:hypothetical protein